MVPEARHKAPIRLGLPPAVEKQATEAVVLQGVQRWPERLSGIEDVVP